MSEASLLTYRPVALAPSLIRQDTVVTDESASAYAILVGLERKLIQRGEAETSKSVIAIRLLGHAMGQVPTVSGVNSLTRAVHSCNDEEALISLGAFYIRYFIRTFRRATGTTPAPSSHPSRDLSFGQVRDDLRDKIDPETITHAAAKKLALIRDHWRCTITGNRDENAALTNPADFDLSDPSRLIKTNAAHIVPQGIFKLPKNSPKLISDVVKELAELSLKKVSVGDSHSFQLHESSSMLAILVIFGDSKILDQINGNQVHRLSNIITMGAEWHDRFDNLRLWLEAVPGAENTYRIRTTSPYIMPERNGTPIETVRFNSTDELEAPLPEFLASHATCCRVAHMSGAADYIEKIYQDQEELKSRSELSTDPKTMELLNSVLDDLNYQRLVPEARYCL